MKYIKQLTIIMIIALIGEGISYLIPVSVPGSIYGFVILFICLVTKLIPLDAVKETAHFMVEIMIIMFVPACVGLMDSWDTFKSSLVFYVAGSIISAIIVMGISGRVTQTIARRNNKEKKEDAA